jgi:8-oxo-dGTP pyrophosphatase MutT (NUDIX family)
MDGDVHDVDGGSWKTLGRSYLYRNPWCAFRVDEVRLPDGALLDYGVLESGGYATVVPVTDSGDVVLVRQWRQPLGRTTLELPSGGVDAGEAPEEAAARELFEETGYRAEGLELLATVHTSTGRSTEVCHVFRCRAVRGPEAPAGEPPEARPEPTEFIRVVELPFGEALEKVAAGEVTAASSVLGLMWPRDGAA